MASQTQTESQVIELATESFKAFCDDIAGMFGVGMQCEQQEVRAETVGGLKKCFKKLVAVNVVESTGALEGTFQLIFDQEGLFTLGGMIVMLPEQRILSNRKDPSPQLAASMVDAVGEAGNLLVGSWDRIFREGIRKHGHFLQRLPAFIGKPWDEPQSKIGLPADGELIYIPYEMTIGTYPPFNCGVIFPKSLFAGHSEVSSKSDSEPAADTSDGSVPEDAVPEAQTPQDIQTSPAKAGSKEPGLSDKSDTPQDVDPASLRDDGPETATAVPSPAETSQGGEDTAGEKTEPEQPAAAQEDVKKKSKSRRSAARKTPANEGQVKKDTPDTPAEEAVELQADSQGTDKVQAQAGPTAEPQSAGDIAGQEPAPVVTVGAAPRGRPGQPHEVAPTDKSGTPCDASGETQVIEPPAGQDTAPSQEHQEPAAGKVSEAIRKMTQSYAALPGESDPSGHPLPAGNCRTDRSIISKTAAAPPPCLPVEEKSEVRQATRRRRGTIGLSRFMSICAKDVMQGRIIWASPDETVQQALAKMQQHDTGYIMVGADGALEGIVSQSDITGALSPYLRSIFAKWRRPLDDATLKIKIKWIMSRPVRTVKPQTPLVTIMENVCRFGGSGLPVVDEQGKVQGLVTVFNIFQTMLNTCANVSTVGRAPQMSPLT